MKRLKPCPFCGSEAMPYMINGEYGYTNDRYGIECTQCGAVIEMSSNGFKNLQDAVAYAWNRRTNNDYSTDRMS